MKKGLPKKYAKLGFKKGWAAYKRAKNSRSRGAKTMAKKKGSIRYRVKKVYKRAKAGLTMKNITKVLTGATLAALYEVFVSPMIPVQTMIKNMVELGVGLFLAAAPRVPMAIKAFGAALATINAYSLVVPYIQNLTGKQGTAAGW